MVTDQRQRIAGGIGSLQWATLHFETKFLSPELNAFGLPVEVRNSEGAVAGLSTAPGKLRVKAPGRYYVLARLPAGQEITKEVEVEPLDEEYVSLTFEEEDVSGPGVDELSYYLGLPERTLLPTEAQSRFDRRPPPVAAPSAPPVTPAAVARDISPALPPGQLESLGEAERSLPPAAPVYDPVEELLAAYASLGSPQVRLEPLGADVSPLRGTRAIDVPKREVKPVDLYLRLFRGNALALKARPLPTDQWPEAFQEGSKARLTLVGADELSTLEVVQAGRPPLNIVLPISAASGCVVVIRRCSVSSHGENTPDHDEVSFDVHMANVKADVLLRYRAQGMLTEASQLLNAQSSGLNALTDDATELLSEKFADPVAAAVGAYGLLKAGNRERREWIHRLYTSFPWLPDGAAIEGECLARNGKHEESLQAFLKVGERGLPLFTDGLNYTLNRLELFTRTDPGSDDEKTGRARLLLQLLRNYCEFADASKLILRYTGRMPHLPSAEPASLSPELVHNDPTVLWVALEAGEEGTIRIKHPTTAVSRSAMQPPTEPSKPMVSYAATPAEHIENLEMSKSDAATNMIKSNDAQRIALRLQRIASQFAESNLVETGVDENTLLERIVGTSANIGSDFLELGKLAVRTVARIQITSPTMSAYGTGFMVSPRLLLTTHSIFSEPNVASQATVDFDYECDARGVLKQCHTFKVRPDLFFLTNVELDFTLVCIDDKSTALTPLSEFGFNRLSGEPGKILVGEPISIVQHPFGRPKLMLLRSGLMMDVKGDFLHYEADTSGVSTGAPIFNSQWEVLGLHHASVPNKMINQGIRISSILRACRAASLANPALQQLLDDVFSPPDIVAQPSTPPVLPPVETPELIPEKTPEVPQPEMKTVEMAISDETSKVKVGESDMTSLGTPTSGTSVTFTLPLHIAISLGTPAPAQPAQLLGTVRESTLAESFLEKIEPAADYENRPGYNPNFLGFPVPMPKLSADIKPHAVKVPGSGHELKYYHYSVIMNGRRKLAFVSAGNFDAKAKFTHEREGSDKWFMDPRILEDLQTGEELYKSNPLDRGHLVRRADAAWGSTAEEARLANDDTFHFTNCSPQHEIFNQSSKATKKKLILWGNIENHIAKQATHTTAKRVTVFNGPIFRQNDRKHRGVPIPREYWKIVVFRNDQNKPRALAFVLSQAALIKTLPTEDFMVGPYDVYQVKVREIELKSKLDFGALRTHDPLEDPSTESFFEAATQALVVSDLRGIIF